MPRLQLGDTEANRIAKYLVLGCLAIIVAFAVFIVFSFYTTRRDLDSELASQKLPSFEVLYQAQRNQNALALASLETRCTERMQIAAFRLLQAKDAERIMEAYDRLFDARVAIVKEIESGRGIINTQDALAYYGKIDSDILNLPNYILPANGLDILSKKYLDYRASIRTLIDKYFSEYNSLSAAQEALASKKYKDIIFAGDAIKALEDRLARIDELQKSQGQDVPADIVARYSVWIESLLGTVPASLQLEYSVSPYLLDKETTLRKLDCLALEKSFRISTGDFLHLPATPSGNSEKRKDKLEETIADADSISIPRRSLYNQFLIYAFTLPAAAQTLLVTLLLGALGAITLNMLRLSKFGWWGDRDDPGWGEVLVGPALGALAAFGVFLVASTGLLLTTGTSAQAGTTPLSAFFVGLLGFLSGLLYDEAFGQVRRVGARFFGDGSTSNGGQSEADREIARELEKLGRPTIAKVAAQIGLGTSLAIETAFTLFIPPDAVVPRGVLEEIVRLKPGAPIPETRKWFDRYICSQSYTRAELNSLAATPNAQITFRSGDKRPVAAANGQMTIGPATIDGAEIAWKNGRIFPIDKDF